LTTLLLAVVVAAVKLVAEVAVAVVIGRIPTLASLPVRQLPLRLAAAEPVLQVALEVSTLKELVGAALFFPLSPPQAVAVAVVMRKTTTTG
jgi:hypothetical protein